MCPYDSRIAVIAALASASRRFFPFFSVSQEVSSLTTWPPCPSRPDLFDDERAPCIQYFLLFHLGSRFFGSPQVLGSPHRPVAVQRFSRPRPGGRRGYAQ